MILLYLSALHFYVVDAKNKIP